MSSTETRQTPSRRINSPERSKETASNEDEYLRHCCILFLQYSVYDYACRLGRNQCQFYKVIWALSRFMFYVSTTVNPIICMTFFQSYGWGFKEATMCFKFLTTGRNVENSEPEEINLQDIRIILGRRENLAFSNTRSKTSFLKGSAS